MGSQIALHCANEYQVAMLGFAPGFPYLLGMDPRLAMPRLSTPRARAAASPGADEGPSSPDARNAIGNTADSPCSPITHAWTFWG